jgi:hypothetical protein
LSYKRLGQAPLHRVGRQIGRSVRGKKAQAHTGKARLEQYNSILRWT